MSILKFDQLEIHTGADEISKIADGYLLKGDAVSLQTPLTPRCYYRHGWQSWSLAAWTDPKPLPVQKPSILHPMQIDPLYAHHPSPNGSWLGAVDFADGNILFLGALGLDSHVQLREGELQGWYESVRRDGIPPHETEWFAAYGPEAEVFDAYAQLLKQKFGPGRAEKPYRVWCSWYSLYTAIDESILYKTFDDLGDLPFDVLQVDDGWQISIGDWEANAKFPSGMDGLAGQIKSTGRKAGLWLAPLLVVPSSKTYREHPDWLLRDEQGKLVSAGFNWGEQLYALDTTHPAALDWLAALMKRVRAWGYDYLKLDFLYAGALPGKRHQDMPREAAYRHGLSLLREAMGADAYFLTCGTPILPALGLCDAMRIGPDVAAAWESQRDAVLLYNPTTPGAKNTVRTTLNRLWLAPLLHLDPDVAYFRSVETKLTAKQNVLLQDLARICNFKATSDLPQWLTDVEQKNLREFLENQPQVERTDRYTFRLDGREVDFGPAITLPEPPKGLQALLGEITGWLGSQPFALKLLDSLGKKKLEKRRQSLESRQAQRKENMQASNLISAEFSQELIEFTQSLVRTKSLSGQEGEVIKLIEKKMLALGYDEVTIDTMGNVLGRIGAGEKSILFDSHVDTVEVNDADKWEIPPFSGEVRDGRLHGRGSVDMKSGAAASIFAGALAKQLGFTADKTIYVSCSVFEEDCDGENLKHLFKELNFRPSYVVICEPSDNLLTLGHKGKAQISIKTHGVSAHGSAPEKGVNAIYEMAEIIQRVEKTNLELMKKAGPRRTLVMSRISSVSASLNAVPSECEVYLDRRMVPGETKDDILQEIEQLIQGKNATWEVGTLTRKSWTGLEIKYEPFHLAWKIDLEHELAQACRAAYHENFGHEPTEYDFWDFSTNAVTPVSLGIPTIGFGPGEYKLAHMRNESCKIEQIIDACSFYTRVIQKI